LRIPYPLRSMNLDRLTAGVLVDAVAFDRTRRSVKVSEVDRFVVSALERLCSCVLVKPFAAAADLLHWIETEKLDFVFNATERIDDDATQDAHICALLELAQVPYTGTSPRGLVLCRDKAVSKMIVAATGFAVPWFFTIRHDDARLPSRLRLPLVVKPRFGDASDHISRRSFVTTRVALQHRVDSLCRAGAGDLICEEYVEGREMFVAILDGEVLPPREVLFRGTSPMPRLLTARIKRDVAVRRRHGVRTAFAVVSPTLRRSLDSVAIRAFDALSLRDYARFDVKLTAAGDWVFLEANPNPPIAPAGKSFTGSWTLRDFDDVVTRIVCSTLERARRSGFES